MEKIKVIIVDDNPLYTKCIEHTLKKHCEIEIIGRFESGLEYLDNVKLMSPDIALLGAKMNKAEVIHTLKLSNKLYPEIKLIVITFLEEIEYVEDLFLAGCSGILLKDSSVSSIIKKIKSIAIKQPVNTMGNNFQNTKNTQI
jgi:DNA-binding NarL/FixJ family response regulator